MSEDPQAAEAAAPGEPIRVFLLDDHEVVRRGVRDGMNAARKRFGRNDDPETKTEPNP